MSETKKGVPVHAVVWEDAQYSDTEDAHTVMAMTFGLLLKRTKKEVVVASEIFNDGTSRHKTAIPRGMIKAIYLVGTIQGFEEEEDDEFRSEERKEGSSGSG